jgi:hypothetical protein
LKKPNVKSVYAFLLSEDKQKPELITVPIEMKNSYEGLIESEQVESFLGNDFYGLQQMPRNPLRPKKTMANTLVFRFRDNFFNDGSRRNKCIESITKKRNRHDWRGPMIILKIKGTNLIPMDQKHIDIELSDIHDVIDYFLYYGS